MRPTSREHFQAEPGRTLRSDVHALTAFFVFDFFQEELLPLTPPSFGGPFQACNPPSLRSAVQTDSLLAKEDFPGVWRLL